MKSILLLMLAVAAFCSCSKDDVAAGSSEAQSVSLSISLGELNMSKSVGETSVDGFAEIGTKLTIHALESADAASFLSEVVLTLANDFTKQDGNIYTSNAGKVVVPGSTTHIRVIANTDNVTLTNEINSRQGNISDAIVRVLGVGVLGTETPTKKCAVTINPEMARIEVKGQMPAADDKFVKEVTLKAIYINNTIMTRGGSFSTETETESRTPSNSNWDSGPFVDNGFKAKLFDAFTPGITYGGGFNSDKTHATGYNVFPQEAATSPEAAPTDRSTASLFHPHMIFKFTLKKATAVDASGVASAWDEEATTYYLNVIALRTGVDVGKNYITKITAANVYQFDLADVYNLMNDTYPSPVTPTPDPETVGVELKVSVGRWAVVEVKPEV